MSRTHHLAAQTTARQLAQALTKAVESFISSKVSRKGSVMYFATELRYCLMSVSCLLSKEDKSKSSSKDVLCRHLQSQFS
jgi:hypothetical protein